jgi:hypothetical protein
MMMSLALKVGILAVTGCLTVFPLPGFLPEKMFI